MNEHDSIPKPVRGSLERAQKRGLIVAAVGVAVCLAGVFVDREQFFRSYLVAYLFWLGVALGCLPILLLNHLTGGRWGFSIRRLLEAGTRTLPLLAILFLPLLLGMKQLYPWSQPDVVAHDEILRHKSAYLNVPFFLVRAVVYFGVWIGLSRLANKWSLKQDEKRDPAMARRFQALGAFGLVLYGLTVTFATVDWVMSLEPHWFSTIFPLLIAVGQVLAGLTFAIVVAAWLAHHKPLSETMTPQSFHDLGNLLLTFVMIWAYFGFSQYLIIWSGNLREEIPWYLHRSHGGWEIVALVLIVLHFAVPFLLLLSRRAKQSASALAGIALGLFVLRFVDLFWVVAPTFRSERVGDHWLDAATLIAVGGIWVAVFARTLKTRPLVPLYDARAEEAVGAKGEAQHG